MAKPERTLTEIIAEANRLGKKAIWDLYNNKESRKIVEEILSEEDLKSIDWGKDIEKIL